MTRKQIENVCRHFGLIEWVDEFCRLVIDGKIENHEFGRLTRKRPRFVACLEMMKTVLSEPLSRQYFDVFPEVIAEIDRAMAIANS